MKRLLTLFVFLAAVISFQSIVAQEIGSLRKGFHFSIPKKIQEPLGDPISAGTYSIGTAGDFSTIDSAFNKLSIDGIAGEVTLELIDDLYIAPTDTSGFLLNGPIPGAGTNSRVTIKPAANTNVTIEGNGRAVLSFINTSFVTLDGVSLLGPSTLTVRAILNTQFPFNDAIEFFDDSDNNIIQNTILIVEDYTVFSSGILFVSLSNSGGAPDNNIIQNNHIKQSTFAIVITAFNSNVNAFNNIIRGNIVGSETSALISWGIQIEKNQNSVIENNIVQNVHNYNSNFIIAIGINSYWCTGCVTRSNVVHNVSSNITWGSVGILLSGDTGNIGLDNLIYNNMIYEIQSTSPTSNSRVTGIQVWYQNRPKIYYNSVYLSGTGTNFLGSAAFYIWNTTTNVEAKNNIFVNTRDESPRWASSIYDISSASNLTSDYNDLYYEPNQYNALVRIGSTKYNNLADWQIASGQDDNSVSKEVFFVSSTDLHLTGSSDGDVDLTGTPIAGITTDIDGEDRRALYPYMGADESTIPLPVELTSFTAVSQLGKVILNWSTATEINNLGFEIERKIISNETNSVWSLVGFREGYGTTTEPREYSYVDDLSKVSTNSLAYRLKQIDFDGSYEYSDEVLVDNLAPSDYTLHQNYPNPFNPVTIINYSLPLKSQVELVIYNTLGEKVKQLVNEEKEAGSYTVQLEAKGLPSGIYFYKIRAGDFVETKKMILLR
jgi:hypothetical protein